ncbi:hypothetical protein ACT3CE_16350 [Marinifilum sp. RC60d5]|uniref:hypothetical protein n=1 Tax=Marinifilum sp. RC60d5 TaxID=3458414 RepID=UPI00403554F6
MKKKNVKKIIRILIKSRELYLNQIDMKISKQELESIFKLLIKSGSVIDLSSKQKLGIATYRDVNYKDLHNNLNLETKAHKIFRVSWKILVGIGIILGIILTIFQIRQQFTNRESKAVCSLPKDGNNI